MSQINPENMKQRVRDLLEGHYGKQSMDDLDRFLRNSAKNSAVGVTQAVNWICDLARIAGTIALVPNPNDVPDTCALFFIRLWALLDEAKPFFLSEEGIDAADFETIPALFLRREVGRAIESIEKCFSEKELLALEYLRVCQCHMHQNGYRLKLNGDPAKGFKLSDKRKNKDIEEILKDVGEVLKPHNNEMNSLAKEWSQRLYPEKMKVVVALAQEWNTQ